MTSSIRYTKKCDASYTTASKPPKIYTTKSTPYYSTTPKSSQTIKCQCVPVYLNNGVEQLSAAYTVTVSFTKGCYSAQQLCKQSCTKICYFCSHFVKPISGLPLNTNLVTGIKNNACRRLYKPIYYTGKSSQLKLYSMLDNRQCSSSRYRSYIRTLDNNFCCSGGTSSYYRKCKAGSGSTYYPL
ncbi:hypothetical protein EB796_023053 [Bugula neritina]|uniref:Uncharacterized protein n=1 Tax=Bugula neritina TaxID=10212 RepID=A0A7J7IYM0_BUGNE|nr:hypothetical protein EB796_023053 [Bugula neritina]